MVVVDVVEEILLRLAVKDLLRYKSVCKSWNSLISSPSFVRLQCKYICNKDHHRKIAMLPYKLYKHERYNHEWHYSWTVGGSSNGLVCLYDLEQPDLIRVLNPSTRKFRELRKSPRIDDKANKCFGFGYDLSTDDYKVVMATSTYSDRGASVHILYLKSNIWKLWGHVNNYWFTYGLNSPGILLNGALHWFWVDYTTNKSVIVSFDLAKEEFKEIHQPDDTRYVFGHHSKLGIIEGRLCIYTTRTKCCHDPPFSVWVMKDYNVKPSWELLPITSPSEMKDHAIHYMLMDNIQSPYLCDDNIRLSKSEIYIKSPIFVQTLVSPYDNDNQRPRYAKNNSNSVQGRNVKERREIEELLEDGEKIEFHLEEDDETERKKRKRKRSGSRNKKRFKSKYYISL